MDERNEKDDALKEYAYDETAGQDASQPEGAPPQFSADSDVNAPSDYEIGIALSPSDFGEDSGFGDSSGFGESGEDGETPSGQGESGADLGTLFESGGSSDVEMAFGSGEHGADSEASIGSEPYSGAPGTSTSPGEPSGYGEQGDPGEPSGYDRYTGTQETPPGYGGNNWQHGAAGYGPGSGPQGYGPGMPPPGYGKNNWQGTPPPGYGYKRPNPGRNPYGGPKKSNNMALASLLLGILSLVLCCCGGFGVILGAVGIVLAILSRGSEPMETSAKVGLGLSIGGIVLGILVLIISFAFVGSEQFRNEMNQNGYGNYENYRHYFEHGGL